MASDAVKNAIASYGAPRSVCSCGHTGDGPDSEHVASITDGHGPCKMCNCPGFCWDTWSKAFEAYLDNAKSA